MDSAKGNQPGMVKHPGLAIAQKGAIALPRSERARKEQFLAHKMSGDHQTGAVRFG